MISKNTKRSLIAFFAGAFALAMVMPVNAQQNRDWQQRNQQNRNQSSSDWQQQSRRGQQGANWQLNRDEYVKIAYDYDGDDKIDAVETIATYDLDKARRSSQQRKKQMQRQGQQGTQQGQQGRVQVEPQGWMKIAYDYDQDNKIDAVETIYAYDLQRALQSSDRRQGQTQRQQSNWQRSQANQQMAQQNRQRSQLQRSLQGSQLDRTDRMRTTSRQTTISGRVMDKDTFRLAGMTEPHVFVKVRSTDGKTHRVDLGKRSDVNRLDVGNGDQIRVTGNKGRVNGKAVIVADRVQSGSRTVTINRTEDQRNRLMRLTGRISDTHTVQFASRQDKSLVATVNRTDGGTAEVILGPQDDLEELNLGAGDRITVLARKVRLNNQDAFAATQFTTADKFVQVERPEQRERFLAQQYRRNMR